jgi:gamma-glutamyltranspeptidase/glutathione hydrolase
VIDYRMDVSNALSAPRIHHQHLPDKVWYEKGGLTSRQIADLKKRGHTVVQRKGSIAVAASILRSPPYWTGASDPRVKGLAQGP